MKKIASILMGLSLLMTTTFAQAKQDTKKQAGKAKTEQSKPASATKKDGTPDKRFKQNKETKTAAVPLKKDGTPDKRYKQSKTPKKS